MVSTLKSIGEELPKRTTVKTYLGMSFRLLYIPHRCRFNVVDIDKNRIISLCWALVHFLSLSFWEPSAKLTPSIVVGQEGA